MSFLLQTNQASKPGTPAAGKVLVFPMSTMKKLCALNEDGVLTGIGLQNASVANATGFASDTYLIGSNIQIPAGLWQAKTRYRCRFDMVKTAAGTAAFTVNVRLGTLGTTGDTSRCALAFAVGTAAADTGLFTVDCTFRSIGSGTSAVVQGRITCSHALAATGLITTGASGFGLINTTGGGFDSTTPTNIGISVNGGASFSGTNTQVQSWLEL